MPSSEHFSLNPFSLNAFSRATRAKWAAAIPVLIRLSVNTFHPRLKAFRLKTEGRSSEHFGLNPFSLNTFSLVTLEQCRLT